MASNKPSADLMQAAKLIADAWRGGIESIIETGKLLIETRQRLHNQQGEWSRLIGAHGATSLLPFGQQHAHRLIAIAADKRLYAHVRTLPSDTYTLYQLTRLSDKRLKALFRSGAIHPGMKRNEASAETRSERKSADEKRILSLVPSDGRFRTLVIDPPWDYEWLSIAGRAAPGYATMSHEQLLAVDVAAWAEDNAHLYLWTTNNFLTRAVDLMHAWGFQHKTVITGVKRNIGLGSYFRNSTEHMLFGVRGEMMTRRQDIPTHFDWGPQLEHSEKPETSYDLIRAASYPPYGEVFQREPRADFTNLFVPEVTPEAAE